jgi:antitoxin CcdA
MRMSDGFAEDPRPFVSPVPRRGKKRAANVSIDQDVLDAAKKSGINLSQTLEDALRRTLRAQAAERWKKDGKAAINSYNRFIEENGIWSEEYRKW